MSVQVLQDRAADGAVAAAGIFAGISLSSAVQLVQIGAGLVAIISGLCAARYYWKKGKSDK